jgi:hypothetical protein
MRLSVASEYQVKDLTFQEAAQHLTSLLVVECLVARSNEHSRSVPASRMCGRELKADSEKTLLVKASQVHSHFNAIPRDASTTFWSPVEFLKSLLFPNDQFQSHELAICVQV